VPTLQELGFDTLADSPYGFAGPRGMEPAVTQRLHDAFKKRLDDPAVLAAFEKFDQALVYMNGPDYTRLIHEQYATEKTIIERLGLALKT
jgi:tripartite-type tricarboxylate transporter receptor subunit TctC